MEANRQVIDTLNDLILINRDRTQCYEKAADEVSDPFDAEIKSVFYQMADESRRYAGLLSLNVRTLSGELANETNKTGEVFRAWNELRVNFAGNDLLTTIQSCQCGDDAVLRAYSHAIEMKMEWPRQALDLVVNQYKSLKGSFERIKRYHAEFVEKVKMVG